MEPQIREEGTRESGPDLWDVLPTECKRLVLQHLALKDVARAARTCRELAQYADDLLTARTTVNIPYGGRVIRGGYSSPYLAPAIYVRADRHELRNQGVGFVAQG
jgi:hypothetical protein